MYSRHLVLLSHTQIIILLSCFYGSLLGVVVCHLQLKQASYSHQTICTYITSKLTPFESVKCIIMLHLLYYDYMMFTHA